jgi:putative acetyltransferase
MPSSGSLRGREIHLGALMEVCSRMKAAQVVIREFTLGDELRLREVFHSSVHRLAGTHYTAEQLEAWAPLVFDTAAWIAKIRALRPFVAVKAADIAGYASLGKEGYIDHFYVAAAFAGQGIGTALINHLLAVAARHRIAQLTAHVSLCAEEFFATNGFIVVERQTIRAGEVTLANARMCRSP